MVKNLPLIGGGALVFVLGVLATRLRSWLDEALKALGEKLYKRLAGYSFLHRTALTRYTKALYKRHETFPVSFRRDDSVLNMRMESVYVPLRTTARVGADSGRRDAAAALRDASRTVVLGVPGAGKTMLLRHEVLAWAAQRYRPTQHRRGSRRLLRRSDVDTTHLVDVPVLIELHRFNPHGDKPPKLEELIADHFARHDFPGAKRYIDRALSENRLAVYLDGLDEVAFELRGGVIEEIKAFTERHADCRVVVTCRVAVYDRELANHFGATLRVDDFDEHLIRRFLLGWPWPEMADDTVETLMAALRDTPQLMPLARNPLMLTLIAYLYTYEYAGTDQVLPHTRADFYKQVIDNLLSLKRDLNKDQKKPPSHVKKAVLRHLALAAQDVPAGTADRLALPESRVLDSVRASLVAQKRSPDAAEDVLSEIVQRSGLLLTVDGGERYQFAHLTLQEYLAADELADDAEALLRRYRDDPQTWREGVRLWCGVAARDCTQVVRAVLAEDRVLAFQCLADAQRIDDALAEQIVAYFRANLGAALDDRDIMAAFALVAADRRPRGAEVFDFLKQAARSDPRPDRMNAAIRCLAATNDPRAAEVLAELFPTHPAARTALATMGDRAVSALSRAAKRGETQALEALWTVRSPRAALVLAEILFADSAQLATIAAVYLGNLLKAPEIEAALHTAPVPTARGQFAWIWTPFAVGPDDALVPIAARIFELLTKSDLTTIPHDPLPPIDPKLAIPLCAMGERFGPFSQIEISERLKDHLLRIAALSEKDNRGGIVARRFLEESKNSSKADLITLADMLRASWDSSTLGEDLNQTLTDALVEAAAEILRLAGLTRAGEAHFKLLDRELRLATMTARIGGAEVSGPESWEHIRNKSRDLTYTYDESWHFRSVLVLLGAVSAVAVARAIFAGIGQYPWGSGWLDWVVASQIIVGWLALFAIGEILNDSEAFLEFTLAAIPIVIFLIIDRGFDEEFAAALACVGLMPSIGVFFFISISQLDGVFLAILISVMLVSVVVAVFVYGLRKEDRARIRANARIRNVLELALGER